MKVGLVYDPDYLLTGETEERSHVYECKVRMRRAIESALCANGHHVVLIAADDEIIGRLREARIDVVFNVSSGISGPSRQSYVPAILERLSIPYTGSGVLSLTVGLDKPTAKKLFVYAGIPTPNFQLFCHENDELDPQLRFPLLIKPSREGSSLGITAESLAYTEAELREAVKKIILHYRQPALVEEFLEGREFTVGILGNKKPIILPIREIGLPNLSTGYKAFRTFKSKIENQYLGEDVCPAPLPWNQAEAVRSVALAAYRAINCCDFARVDIRLDTREVPHVLEINTLPELDPTSGSFVPMAVAGGFTYEALIETILQCACERYDLGADRMCEAE